MSFKNVCLCLINLNKYWKVPTKARQTGICSNALTIVKEPVQTVSLKQPKNRAVNSYAVVH